MSQTEAGPGGWNETARMPPSDLAASQHRRWEIWVGWEPATQEPQEFEVEIPNSLARGLTNARPRPEARSRPAWAPLEFSRRNSPRPSPPPPPHRSRVPGAKTTKRLRSEPGWAGRPIQNSSARIGHDQSQRSFGPSRPAVLFFSRGLVSRNRGPFVRLCPVQRQGKVSSGITLGVDTQERGSCWGVGLSPWHRRGQG